MQRFENFIRTENDHDGCGSAATTENFRAVCLTRSSEAHGEARGLKKISVASRFSPWLRVQRNVAPAIRFFAVCCLLGLGLAWSSWAQTQTAPRPGQQRRNQPKPQPSLRGGELIYGEGEGAGNLNPYTRTAARGPSDRLFALIYESLVRYDFAEDSVYAVLASSWEKKDRTIIFYLRRNVTWHDGIPLTAKDVQFTIEYIKRIARPQISLNYNVIESVQVVDDYSLIVNFSNLTADAINLFDTWIIPKHLFDERYLDRQGVTPLSSRPIGTGPYLFGAKTIEGDVALKINDAYWGARGNIESVLMKYIPDPSGLVNNALFGGIKLVIETPPQEITRLENSGLFNLKQYQSFTIHVFAHNCEHPVLKNPDVRKALTLAVNREEMLKQWYAGKGKVLSGPFVEEAPYFNPQVLPLPYNPEEAKRLLENAGYRDTNGDGSRETPADRKPLKFRLTIPVERVGGSTVVQNVAESYASYLRAVGVQTELEPLDLDTYLRRLLVEHKFDIAWKTWTFDPSYDITDLFRSQAKFAGGNNFVSYGNTLVDEAIALFERATDRDLRKRIMQQLHKILAEACPYTFLYSPDNYAAVHLHYAGTRIEPYYFFTYFPQWYIPQRYRAAGR